jgi:hypothetical protein
MNPPGNLQGWLPVRVLRRGDDVSVVWVLMGDERLLDPFFEETVRRVMAKPFHKLFQRETSMDELVAWTEAHPGVPLRGLVYHMSRCGSTLMAQQLAVLPQNIVCSEPPPLDSLLRAERTMPELPRATLVRWIRAMVSALGQARHGESALYIKMDCWNIHRIGLMQEAFPEVPWCYLYREPVEVMRDHSRLPAMWLVPGLLDPGVLQLEHSDWVASHKETYWAQALAKICASGLDAVRTRHGGQLVNHKELPEALCGRLREHFGLRPEDVPAMRERGKHNAKSPGKTFTGDAGLADAALDEKLESAATLYAKDVYEELEAERLR